MDPTAGKAIEKIAIDRPAGQLAPAGRLLNSRVVFKGPADLRPGKIGIQNQPGFFLEKSPVGRLCLIRSKAAPYGGTARQ